MKEVGEAQGHGVAEKDVCRVGLCVAWKWSVCAGGRGVSSVWVRAGFGWGGFGWESFGWESFGWETFGWEGFSWERGCMGTGSCFFGRGLLRQRSTWAGRMAVGFFWLQTGHAASWMPLRSFLACFPSLLRDGDCDNASDTVRFR